MLLDRASQFVFLTPQLAVKWWGTVAKEFEAAHPNVTVKYTPIPGGYNDIINKLDLLYRTPSTAPDVAGCRPANSGRG